MTTPCWTRFRLIVPTSTPAALSCWWTVLCCLIWLAPASLVLAQKQPESSPEAILQYRSAVPLQNNGSYDLAVEEWEKFITKFPMDPLLGRARYNAGICYLQLQQYDQAQAAFEKLLAEQPQYEKLEDLYFNLGVTYLSNGKKQTEKTQAASFAKAAETFATLNKKFPTGTKVAEALYNQADALYLANQKAAAIPIWRELVDKQTKSELRPDALYNIGVTYQELDKPAEAGQVYDEFLKNFAKDKHLAEVTLRRGMTHYDQKQYAEAEKKFAAAAASKDFKQADYALLRQGDTLLALDKRDEAAASYQKLIQDFPKSEYLADAQLQAGKALTLAGKHQAAQAILTKLSAEDRAANQAEAVHWLARSLIKANQPNDALKAVDAALPRIKNPDRQAELMLDRAEALYAMNDRKSDALQAYLELTKQAPQSTAAITAQYMAAQAALELNDLKQAKQLADRFLQTNAKHELAPYVLFIAAESSLLGDDLKAAEQAFDQLLRDHAQHPEVAVWRLRRGWVFIKQKQYAPAVDHFTALLKDLKQPEQVAEAQYLLGNAQLEQQDSAAAIKAYNAALTAAPTGRLAEDILLNLARAQRANKDVAAAKVTLVKLLKDFPQTKQADRVHFRLGELQHSGGEFKAALTEFQWIIDNAPKSSLLPDALFGMAAAQAALQDFAGAQKLYSQLLTDHPQAKGLLNRAKFGRAVSLIQQQQYPSAVADLRDYLGTAEKGAETSEARYLLGYALSADKKYDEATQALEALLAEDNKYPQLDKVLYELAWAQQLAGKKEQAKTTFTKLATEHQQSVHAAEAWINVGDFAYQEKKDYPAAAKAYEQALAAGAKETLAESARHMLGWSLFNQNDFAGAAKQFAEQIKQFPQGKKVADGTFMSGETLFKQNQHEAALPLLEKAVGTELSAPLYKELALLHAAQSAAQLKKWPQSDQLAEQFLKQFTDSVYLAEAAYEQAWAKQNQKQLDAALPLYDKAVLAASKTGKTEVAARALFMSGEVLFEQAQHKEAIKRFYQVAYGSEYEAQKTWQGNSLYEAARCFEVLKNVEQAKKLYSELVKKFADSDKVKPAQQRLDALK